MGRPHTCAALICSIVTSTALAQPPRIGGCQVFPASNIWNTPIDRLPVDPNSATYVSTIGADKPLVTDFGSGSFQGAPIGIPFSTVAASQRGVPVAFTDYPDESDPGPYPVPADAPIEGGPESKGDRHVLVVQQETCKLYELFGAYPQPDGSWKASSGAVFDLTSNALRPAGWTSADAAGFAIVPGLVRHDEVAAGEIRHAIRFTAPQTRRQYVWPATHFASKLTDSKYPPMGQRFRLRADYDISAFSQENQVILRALKKYGLLLADNGSPWYLSGAPDEHWNNDRLRELRRLQGSDFEAVDTSSLRISPSSAEAAQAPREVVNGASFLPSAISAGEIITINAGRTTASAAEAPLALTFDGDPAKIYYASPEQVNALVPYSVSGKSAVDLRLVAGGTEIYRADVPVAPAAPALFFTVDSARWQAAALNQDYSLNGIDNPSVAGSVLMLFGTGLGPPDMTVSARIAGLSAEVSYAGDAPGWPGLKQVNVQVPNTAPHGPASVLLYNGAYPTQGDITVVIR